MNILTLEQAIWLVEEGKADVIMFGRVPQILLITENCVHVYHPRTDGNSMVYEEYCSYMQNNGNINKLKLPTQNGK